MIQKKILLLILVNALFCTTHVYPQLNESPAATQTGWLSLGGRSTVSYFGHEGTGLGTGGQFRIQLNNRVNTDWFADYITINTEEGVRSTYYHIGWSVLYYPFTKWHYPKLAQPYILAGHCFDYNKKTVMKDPSNSKSRWGSAVQAGIGSHLHLSEKFDVSITTQYMIHLTKALEVETLENGETLIYDQSHSTLEGHLLTTLSFNYKLFRLW